MRRGLSAAVAGAAALLLQVAAPNSVAAEPAALGLRLTPAGDGIDVAVRFDPVGTERPTLALPFVVSNVETAAASVGTIAAEDNQGPLTFAVEAGDAEGIRRWIASRPVVGTVRYRYRAPAETRLAARGAAPPLELRRDAAAVSGAGSTFLILPEGEGARSLSVGWDVSGPGARPGAISSLGEAENPRTHSDAAGALQRSFFMAGAIGQYPPAGEASVFRSAWQGQPPFDAERLMRWAGELHRHFLGFFRVAEPAPYTIFLRRNLTNPGGGVGLLNSFVATYGDGTDGEALKLTLAHEMFHTFAPSLSSPAGLESSWFGEGLATHYQRVLPLRFGQIGPDAFLEDLNGTAARYYTSVMAEVPNSEVPARFWEDTRIRTLPYDRGALYFADLNHRVKLRSGGRRSLDDLLMAMVERQRAGRALGNPDWEDVLAGELGQEGVDHFRAMLAGTPPLPASDAFGPCFRRTTRALRRYELGFDPKVLVESPRIVRGLVPGSAAEQGGLRDGDEILRPVPQDAIQGDQQALLRLAIRRDGVEMPVVYLPRGELVQAWQWERVPDSGEYCSI